MTELEIFHERILNWARCYRYRRARVVSPTATVIDRLRLYGPGRLPKEREYPPEEKRPVDEADAALLEAVFASNVLSEVDKKVLRNTYCSLRVPLTFSNTQRQRIVFSRLARSLGLFQSDFQRVLSSVEWRFMRAVETAEMRRDGKKD